MNFTTVPDKNVGDAFTQAMWATYVEQNLNLGVARLLAPPVLLGSAAASIDIASIPATFAHLLVVAFLRGDAAATGVGLNVKLNNDAGAARYIYDYFSVSNSTVTGSSSAGTTSVFLPTSAVPAASIANMAAAIEFLIPNYTDTTLYKTMRGRGYGWTATPGPTLDFGAVYQQAVAINEVALSPSSGNFVAGSMVSIYGLPS